MPEELTPAELAELKRLLEKATPGPLTVQPPSFRKGGGRLRPYKTAVSSPSGVIANFLTHDTGHYDTPRFGEAGIRWTPPEPCADAKLYAALRNAAPALIEAAEERESLRVALQSCEQELSHALDEKRGALAEYERLRPIEQDRDRLAGEVERASRQIDQEQAIAVQQQQRAETAEAQVAGLQRRLTEAEKDGERLDWLAKNDIVQQEVGSDGWRLPELSFRAALDAAREKGAVK